MFKRLLQKIMPSEPKGDCLYAEGPDGKPSNQALHEALMEDVDDAPFRQKMYEQMKASGASEDLLALFK